MDVRRSTKLSAEASAARAGGRLGGTSKSRGAADGRGGGRDGRTARRTAAGGGAAPNAGSDGADGPRCKPGEECVGVARGLSKVADGVLRSASRGRAKGAEPPRDGAAPARDDEEA